MRPGAATTLDAKVMGVIVTARVRLRAAAGTGVQSTPHLGSRSEFFCVR